MADMGDLCACIACTALCGVCCSAAAEEERREREAASILRAQQLSGNPNGNYKIDPVAMKLGPQDGFNTNMAFQQNSSGSYYKPSNNNNGPASQKHYSRAG